MGFDNFDDVGAYQISDNIAVIENIDLITPVVDDPYMFGQIAVANALSDLYAKGVDPLMAMNIVCFPINVAGIDILVDILKGAQEKLREANVVLGGGHTIEDIEPKFGLAIVGIAEPTKIIKNSTAQPGDALILTKPIGSGTFVSAAKRDLVENSDIGYLQAINNMAELNRTAARLMVKENVNGCTDITGFGLLGHLHEMITASNVGAVVYTDKIPVLPGAEELVKGGFYSSAAERNHLYYSSYIQMLQNDHGMVFFEAETSGGLLISIPKQRANRFISLLMEHGIKSATIIGEIQNKPKGRIILQNNPL